MAKSHAGYGTRMKPDETGLTRAAERVSSARSTASTCRIPGVNRLASYGRRAFAEFGDVHEMQDDFEKKVLAQAAGGC
jgi:hypothetical protein